MKRLIHLSGLHPDFRPKIERLIGRVEDEGWPLKLFETLRTMERQAALFAQGRTEPGHIVTNAQPGESAHNHGFAADLVEFDSNSLSAPWTWDVGLDVTRTRVLNRARWGMWVDYGKMLRAEFPSLRWGAVFGYRPPMLIGWDPPHVEEAGWRHLFGS